MPTCEACNGAGECKNEFHPNYTFLDLLNSCEDCESDAGTPGSCPDCDGAGIVDSIFHQYSASWMRQ